MTRSDETSLANDVARLSRLIAESESLASRPVEEETLRFVEADLARWRQSRERFAATLRRTKFFNRLTSIAQVTFWFGLAMLCGMTALPFNNKVIYAVFLVGLILLMIVSGATYILAITIRDAVERGRGPLRFSVRSLLIIMTIAALVLGLWFSAVRY